MATLQSSKLHGYRSALGLFSGENYLGTVKTKCKCSYGYIVHSIGLLHAKTRNKTKLHQSSCALQNLPHMTLPPQVPAWVPVHLMFSSSSPHVTSWDVRYVSYKKFTLVGCATVFKIISNIWEIKTNLPTEYVCLQRHHTRPLVIRGCNGL